MYNLQYKRLEEREILFNGVCQAIEAICDVKVFEDGNSEEYKIGAAYTDGDFLLMDNNKGEITIYLDNKEKMTFRKDDNFLLMMEQFIKEVREDF